MGSNVNMLTFNATVSKYSTLVMELDIARSAGFKAVEMTGKKVLGYLNSGFSEEDLRNELKGLVVQGIGAVIDIERQGEGTKELMREAEDLYKLASKIGAKGIQIVTGPINVQAVIDFQQRGRSDFYTGLLGYSRNDQVELTANNLRMLADSAREYGLILYLEALSWSPLNTIDQQLRLLERTGRDNLKLVIDYWHCYTSGISAREISKIDGDLIYGVHVCDSLIFEGGVPIEVTLRDVPTGSGVLNLKEWTDAVKSTGYKGWWCSETFCKRQQQGNSYEVARSLRAQLDNLVNGC